MGGTSTQNDASKFAFIGVTTRESLVNKYFSDWSALLDQRWVLVHMDADIGDTMRLSNYLLEINDDPTYVGALVTSHKAALYELGLSMGVESVTPAGSLREAGFLDRCDGRLRMRVSDVDSQKPVLRRLTACEGVAGGEFLILGAGGAGLALAWNTAVESIGAPKRVTIVESDPSRVSVARDITSGWELECQLSVDNSSLCAAIESASSADTDVTFIVNATGEGKDRPSTPCDVRGFAGRRLVFWDFNYRGSLDLLHSFAALCDEGIIIEDGREYFYGGWSVVMSGVAGRVWTPDLAASFGRVAEVVDSA